MYSTPAGELCFTTLRSGKPPDKKTPTGQHQPPRQSLGVSSTTAQGVSVNTAGRKEHRKRKRQQAVEQNGTVSDVDNNSTVTGTVRDQRITHVVEHMETFTEVMQARINAQEKKITLLRSLKSSDDIILKEMQILLGMLNKASEGTQVEDNADTQIDVDREEEDDEGEEVDD